MHTLFRWFVCLALAMMPGVLHAEPFIEHLEPPALERGKTTRLTIIGHDLAQTIGLWSSWPSGVVTTQVVESTSERAVVDVTVRSDANVGLGGIRLATRDGLSNVQLMLIDDLPIVTPNKDKLALPACVTGLFRQGEMDHYLIDVTAGQRVSFEVVAGRFGKNADPLVTLRDSQGRFIAEHDNDAGLVYDCRFEHTFRQAGTYRIEVRDARYHGNEHHRYALRIGRFPAARVAVPAAVRVGDNALSLPEVGELVKFHQPQGQRPGAFYAVLKRPEDQGSTWVHAVETSLPIQVAREYDYARAAAQTRAGSPSMILAAQFTPWSTNPFQLLDPLIITGRAQATPVVVPGILAGVLRQPGERHTFAFDLTKGQTLHLRAESATIGSPADIEVMVIDRFGREQRRSREEQGEVLLDYTAGQSGLYGLMVRDLQSDGGPAFAYRITVRDAPFPPQLQAEVEGLTIPQGTYQPIPIRIQRQGTTGPITLKLLEAPPGVTLTPERIEENQSAVIAQLHAAGTTPIGISTLQIAAETSAGTAMVRTLPLIDRQLQNVDLILLGLREDQRRLPPSLTDCFALQIVPASPYTLELPAAVVTLGRYQHADFTLQTTREPGFDAPIIFSAKGGQLADKNEGRTRVYADLPEANRDRLMVVGSVHSKILTNLSQARIEVVGETTHQGRRIRLMRTFTLDVVSAFRVSSELPSVALLPGERKQVPITITRLVTFAGPVELALNPMSGVQMPEKITVPAGQNQVTFDVVADADAMPRKQRLSIQARAEVSGYEEEFRADLLEIEIRKVEPVKK